MSRWWSAWVGEGHTDKLAPVVDLERRACIRNDLACFRVGLMTMIKLEIGGVDEIA
jgi:hypothetical protein